MIISNLNYKSLECVYSSCRELLTFWANNIITLIFYYIIRTSQLVSIMTIIMYHIANIYFHYITLLVRLCDPVLYLIANNSLIHYVIF